MSDYQELSLFELKEECKRAGLDSKGTKAELIARLNGVEDSAVEATQEAEQVAAEQEEVQEETKLQAAKPEETVQPDLTQASTPDANVESRIERMQQFLPSNTGLVPKDATQYAPWVSEERLSKLENALKHMSAGKGSFKMHVDNNACEYYVTFQGGGQGITSTTLIDTDQQILKEANLHFNGRFHKGTASGMSRL